MTHHRIPRALRGGDAADAPGEIGAAGRELHSLGTPGDRVRQAGAGGKLANTSFSLRRVNPVRGGTSPAS